MPTIQEIVEEAEALYPQDRERQRMHISQRLPEVGDDNIPISELQVTEPPEDVSDVASRLTPTRENAAFLKKLEEIDQFDELVNPPTTPVAKTQPAPGQPKDEDMSFLVDLVEQFGTKPPTRIDGYTDDQLETLIDLGSPNSDEARTELTARRSGDPANKAKRLSGQMIAGSAEIPTSGPLALSGIVTKAAEFVTGTDLGADTLLQLSEEIRRDVRKEIGISDPRDISESAATIAGGLIPIPGLTAPNSIIGNAIELTTPLLVGSGNKRVAANFMFGAAAEQGIRELSDTTESPYRTAFDIAGLTGEEDTNYPGAVKAIGIGLGFLAGTTILTPMVMQQLRNNPIRRRDIGEPIRALDPTGPEGLRSIERAGDVRKAYYVDTTQVLADLADRAGVTNITGVKQRLDQDTQMSAVMRVNEAMRVGKLRTSEGSWDVDITPNQLMQDYRRLPPAIQSDIDGYLKYKDLEDVLQSKVDIATKKLEAEGIPDDQFMKISDELDQAQEALVTARQSAFTLQQRTPEVAEYSSRYQHIVGATRQFLASGDSAMLSPTSLQTLEKTRPNFVPSDIVHVDPTAGIMQRITDATRPVNKRDLDNWYRGTSDTELDITKRADSFETLVDYTRSALQAKMHNDVRNVYVGAMRNSPYGSETIRRATQKEVNDYPNRVVEVWEGGKKQKYISSQLQADLLQLDSYYPKYTSMFMLKRLFEQGTTGVLSPTFALTTFIRDSVAGSILKEPGKKGPLGPELAFAVPRTLWAKGQVAVTDVLQNSLQDVPFLDQTAKLELSKQISNSYMNSYYHMFNEAGGIGASLTRESIQVQRGVLRELARTAETVGGAVPGLRTLGHSLAVLGKGWAHLFDAVAEAPRFSAAQRNIKAGIEPVEAVSAARRTTGDVTRSGRAYLASGRRITGDVRNRGALATSAVEAPLIQFIRESTPYYNPMIQGMRKLINSAIDDPVGTQLRAWTGVGLPAIAIYAWNEMLGEEYNKYNFERRSSSQIAMNFPGIGIPGQPPEDSIQIPIAHELMMFNSPWTTAINAMANGEDGEEIKKILMHMGMTTLENSAMIGFPQALTAGAAVANRSAPESLVTPWNWADDVYEVRDDNAGLMPANTELMIRSMFGGVSDAIMTGAAAFYDGGMEAAFEELGNSLLAKTPITKNLSGNTTSVSNFTPISEERFNKISTLFDFLDVYDEHIMKPQLMSMSKLSSAKGAVEDEDADVFTRQRLSPIGSPAPTNPVFLEYADTIKDKLDRNSSGATGLKSRYSLLSNQIRSLKNYTAGRKDEFRKWQRQIEGSDIKYQEALQDINARYSVSRRGGDKEQMVLTKDEYQSELRALQPLEEKAKADRLVTELKLDLSKRSDVMKLVDHLEQERVELMKEHLKLINIVEDEITQDMQSRGMLQPGRKFTLEDLQPN